MASTVVEQPGSGGAPAPQALRPPPGNPRFPLLDSVRAIAALAVLTTHVAGVSGFNFKSGGEFTTRLTSGVTLFFVLSGFLIYRPFVAARLDARAAPRPLIYLRRRALRIIPAYWLALTVLTIWPGLGGDVFAHPFRYYLFLQTASPYTVFGGMTQVWSLCVEVAFYLALPIYAFAVGRWLRGRDRELQVRVELAGLVMLAIASVILRRQVHVANPASTLELQLPAFLYWFGLGMALAVISAWLAHRSEDQQPRFVGVIARRPWLPWLGAAITFWVVSTRFGIPYRRGESYDETQLFAEHVLYGLTALLFVLPAVFADHAGGWPRRILADRRLAWLGLISYGIFLWNLAVATELWHSSFIRGLPQGTIGLVIATLAVTVAIASASYYFVERPLLRFKDPRPRRAA